ncbi:MAG: hypothetical protein PHF86_04600 [Candidatus Nanoarchaeia archaeon]|jgi:hypothetical protein|nr:hypothetical protein [Candidatus Nanoarchaeia archaeon]
MILTFGKKPSNASFSDTLDLMYVKTGIKPNDLLLLIDAFSFFIRKVLIETGHIYIYGLGRFFIRHHALRIYKKKYDIVHFVSCDDFKERIKRTRNDVIKFCNFTDKEFKVISDLFGYEIDDVKYLSKLFFYCVPIYLLKYKIFKIPRFGSFVLEEVAYEKMCISKKYGGKNINRYRIRFYMIDGFFRELNKKTNCYYMYDRLIKMFVIAGVSRKITRKKLDVNYDYKKNATTIDRERF